MTVEVFGKQFCLVHKSGQLLYPIRVKNNDTGKVAFRISPGGSNGNTKELGTEESDESKVFARVITDGWAVRVASLNKKTTGLYKIGQRSITGFRDLR